MCAESSNYRGIFVQAKRFSETKREHTYCIKKIIIP